MEIDTLIDMLLEYRKDSNKSDNKEIYKSYQQEYLNGYAGVIINSLDQKFEIYLYIKNTSDYDNESIYNISVLDYTS